MSLQKFLWYAKFDLVMIRWLTAITEDQQRAINLFMTILLSTGFIVSTSLNPFIIAFYRSRYSREFKLANFVIKRLYYRNSYGR